MNEIDYNLKEKNLINCKALIQSKFKMYSLLLALLRHVFHLFSLRLLGFLHLSWVNILG